MAVTLNASESASRALSARVHTVTELTGAAQHITASTARIFSSDWES